MDFDEYVRTQRPPLMRFATVLSGQTWLAEDLVSDVLGKAFERWDHIGSMSYPHAYVRRMLVNDHLSWRRQRQRRPTTELIDHSPPIADGSQERAERDDMLTRLDRLPKRQRAAVVLRYYAGLPDAEIAVELGCRESTVRSQISRALQSLRIDLTDHDGLRSVISLETR